MIHWSEDSLWQKARLMVTRAKQNPREGPLFAFWSTLALEMLARSVLSSINPCLLADIRGDDRTANNLFYACGLEVETLNSPISVMAKTVFSRCEKVIPELVAFKTTREDLLARRNEDVHSGGPGFQGLDVSKWIADYYQMCTLLLEYRQLSLSDLFGLEEAKIAQRIIVKQEKDDKKTIQDLIAKFRKDWDSLTDNERKSKEEIARKTIVKFPPRSAHVQKTCPSCSNRANLIGLQTFQGPTRLDGKSLTQDITALPEVLLCNFCGLKILHYKNLRAAGFDAEFTVSENPDPVEFHEIDVNEYVEDMNYYEPEYGND
jgi:hypothetical protein